MTEESGEIVKSRFGIGSGGGPDSESGEGEVGGGGSGGRQPAGEVCGLTAPRASEADDSRGGSGPTSQGGVAAFGEGGAAVGPCSAGSGGTRPSDGASAVKEAGAGGFSGPAPAAAVAKAPLGSAGPDSESGAGAVPTAALELAPDSESGSTTSHSSQEIPGARPGASLPAKGPGAAELGRKLPEQAELVPEGPDSESGAGAETTGGPDSESGLFGSGQKQEAMAAAERSRDSKSGGQSLPEVPIRHRDPPAPLDGRLGAELNGLLQTVGGLVDKHAAALKAATETIGSMDRTIEGQQALIKIIVANQERLRNELEGCARQLGQWARSVQVP